MRSTQNQAPKNGIDFGNTSGVLEVDCSKANTFEAVLVGNITLNITNLPPGQECSVFVTQDGVGGRTVGFSGMTIEKVDAASLLPGTTAAASTSWLFQGVSQASGTGVCRLVSASGAGGGGIVTAVTGSGNIQSSGGTTPNITIVANPTFATSVTTPLIVAPTNFVLDVTAQSIIKASATQVLRAPEVYIEFNTFHWYSTDTLTHWLELTAAAAWTYAFDAATVTSINVTIGTPKVAFVPFAAGAEIQLETTALVSKPFAGANTGAQNLSLKKSNVFEIGALAGDTAITFIDPPNTDPTPHAQVFTLRYSSGTHHATFTNIFWPVAPAALNLAALSAAETPGANIVIQFYWGTDGRGYVLGWTAN